MTRKEILNASEGPGGLSEHGMHILISKDPDAPECIDIVAVHGLNGHWKSTWTDERTDTNWLRDGIPGHIPTARVMSFFFDSTQFTKSTTDGPDFADQLLDDVSSQRISETEQDRPIIFICHSLGGILFKQVCTAL
jgi:protein SERAC1